MHKLYSKNILSKESISAIFIIALVCIFIFANFAIGFSFSIYAITMAIAFGIAVVFPESGLYAIIFLTFIFERFFTLAPILMGRNEYKLYPIDILLLAIFLAILINLFLRKIKFSFLKSDKALLIFELIAIGYLIFSIFFLKTDFALSFSSAKNYIFYSLLYFAVFLLINTEEKLKRFFGFMLAGAIGIIGFIVYGLITGNGLWSEYTPLSTAGVRTLAFTHAFYLCMALIVAVFYVIRKNDYFSKLLLGIIPIWTIGIIGSMMRHLWISIGVSLAILYMLISHIDKIELRKKVKKYAALFFLIAFFGLYFASLFPNSKLNEMTTEKLGIIGGRVTSITNIEDESIAWRGVVWQEAFKEYKESPIFGIGFGKKVSIDMGKYKDFVEVRNIHNSFLVLFVQMGIVGIGLVVFLIVTLVSALIRKKSENEISKGAKEIALGVLVLQIVAFMFQPYLEANMLGMFFWINLGLMRRLLITNN